MTYPPSKTVMEVRGPRPAIGRSPEPDGQRRGSQHRRGVRAPWLLKLGAVAVAVVIAVAAWPGDDRSPDDTAAPAGDLPNEPASGNRPEETPTGSYVSTDKTHGEPEIAGRFAALSLASFNGCGLRTDGSMLCWEFDRDRLNWVSERRGEFTDVSAARWQDCAVRTDETITCWMQSGPQSPERHRTVHVTDGQFTDVSAGGGHWCALRTDGTVVCRGSSSSGEVEHRRGVSRRSPAAGTIHAVFESTVRSSAGATTKSGRPTCRRGDSPPSMPVRTTPAQ